MSVPEIAITDREFASLRELIYTHAGIALAPCKRYLVQARLGRRLRELGLTTFADYHARLISDTSGTELTRFINAMTTNKTDFFREAHHFEHLASKWLPSRHPGAPRRLRFWSAACSSGEEPYSLAITLLDALRDAAGWDIRILASDIDTDVLARAAEGVYSTEQVAPVPPPLLRRYFLKGTGPRAGSVRIGPAARALITFRRINFLEEPWPIRARFDAIFCRNVLIYFDRPTQQRVLARLVACLAEDGLLFLGHSESAHGLVDGVRAVGPTIYQRVPTEDSCPAPASR